MGRLQWWLQGHPDKRRPWALIWLGNLISSGRYWWWRVRGGEREYVQRYAEFYVHNYSYPTATSSFQIDPDSEAQNTDRGPE